MSVDPLVAVTGQPYEYVGDNPVNATDPSGKLCTTQECIISDAASVMSAASAVSGLLFFVPGAEEVSLATGAVALAADSYNCIVNSDCNWFSLAMDVVGLIPGGAALKASGDVKAMETEIAGAVSVGETLDPSLANSKILKEFVGHVEGVIGANFSAAGAVEGAAAANSSNSAPCGSSN